VRYTGNYSLSIIGTLLYEEEEGWEGGAFQCSTPSQAGVKRRKKVKANVGFSECLVVSFNLK